MKLLLDTHIAFWAIFDPDKLSAVAKKLISDGDNDIYVSSLSFYEIAIKHFFSPEKMPVSGEQFAEYSQGFGMTELPLHSADIGGFASLIKNEHHDLFDRIILGVAKSRNMMLLTHDGKLAGYGEDCVLSV